MKITARDLAKMIGKDERYIYTLLNRYAIRLADKNKKNLFVLMAKIITEELLDNILVPEKLKKKKLARLHRLQAAVIRRKHVVGKAHIYKRRFRLLP
jgi:hypothetical protein